MDRYFITRFGEFKASLDKLREGDLRLCLLFN